MGFEEVRRFDSARFAKANRRRPTDAERRLWLRLRELEIDGSHFRRQVVIGGYIADFASRRAGLVVEVDGGQHCENGADATRTAQLEAAGWRVLRFWNNDVLSNLDGVLEVIVAEIACRALSGTTPTPDPSPQGGWEGAPSRETGR